jgi:hypothetical protein
LNKKKAKVPVQRISKADTLKREAPKWDPERINKETLFVMGSRHQKTIKLSLQIPKISLPSINFHKN